MKLVIEIPKEQYRTLNAKTQEEVVAVIDDKVIATAVKNGTPLPEGHGRLIDAKEYEDCIRKHYFDNNTVIRCTEICLDNAPTIIEADGGDAE